MSKLKHFIGIDISKAYFDCAVVGSGDLQSGQHHQFSQTPAGFKKMTAWLLAQGIPLGEETLFCMEYTGIYNSGLVNYLVGQKAQLWVEMPLRIKQSSGLQRGGDDKSAAQKIALYAFRYQDQRSLWTPMDSSLEKIRHLIGQRNRLTRAIGQLRVPVEELKTCGLSDQAKEMERLQRPAVKQLEKTKEGVEALIRKTIRQDQQLRLKAEQVTSISGIGEVTAAALLTYTKGFQSFDNAKQLACYCGVVPFTKSSGTSVRFKPSVSPHANKKLKTLLHLCALSAIRYNEELKTYYRRKVEEGKNKMSVINAVRNKLVHRVFAVVRDSRTFEENYVRKCA